MANLFIKSTIIIVVVTLLSRLLGLARNILLTNEFGVGIETDAFNMAYTLPLALFLVVPGAISAVMIPAMKGLIGDENGLRRNELFHKALTAILLLFMVISAAGMLWSEQIVSLLAYGFSAEKQEMTRELLIIMMPSALFIGMIAVFSSILNAHHKFFATSFGTVINGLIVIASIYILTPQLGIKGIAWGTTAGFAVYAAYLVVPLQKSAYTTRWNFAYRKDPVLRGMGERFVPILIGIVVSQAYLILEKFMASGLGDEKITTLVLANSIVQLPVAVFAGALAVPIFPLLSEYVKKNQMQQMKDLVGRGFLYQYHLLLPASLGLILLAPEFVAIFYDHTEAFTPHDVELTAWAMIFYSMGMVGWAGRDLLTRASYAIENTKTPVIVGAVSLGVYVLLGWLFIPALDHGGLAVAFSLATYFNMLLQLWFLRRQIGTLFHVSFYLSLGKGIIAAVAMSAVIWLLRGLSGAWGMMQLPIIVIVAVLVYTGCLWVMNESLVKELTDKIVTLAADGMNRIWKNRSSRRSGRDKTGKRGD
ncbi:MAG TPA: murein biosynthesis integral membrane protein MurJ [Bacilli bacterium]